MNQLPTAGDGGRFGYCLGWGIERLHCNSRTKGDTYEELSRRNGMRWDRRGASVETWWFTSPNRESGLKPMLFTCWKSKRKGGSIPPLHATSLQSAGRGAGRLTINLDVAEISGCEGVLDGLESLPNHRIVTTVPIVGVLALNDVIPSEAATGIIGAELGYAFGLREQTRKEAGS